MKNAIPMLILFLSSCDMGGGLKEVCSGYSIYYSPETDDIELVYTTREGYILGVVPSKLIKVLCNKEYVVAKNEYFKVVNYYIIPLNYHVEKDIQRNFFSYREVEKFEEDLKKLKIDTLKMKDIGI